MRPNQIVVFDGLRITTQHVNHVQSAVNSGLYELRAIAGLGRVYSGFDVAADGPDAVIVQPGFGFDHEGNRIVLDEPVRLAVRVGPTDAAYVIARYVQVRDGEVEGRATLIWDSCETLVTATPPGDEDNAIVLARITRSAEGGLQIGAADPDVPEPDVAAPPEPTQLSMAMDQGVLRLPASDEPALDIAAVLAGALRANPAGGPATTIALAAREVALPFAPCGVTSHTILCASLATREGEGEEAGTQYSRFRTRAEGEATLCAAGVKQFGVSHLCGTPDAQTWAQNEDMTEAGIAQLPLRGAAVERVRALLDRLTLLARIESSSQPGFHARCSLAWSGEGGEDIARQVETDLAGMSWQALVAWKAVGIAAASGTAVTNASR